MPNISGLQIGVQASLWGHSFPSPREKEDSWHEVASITVETSNQSVRQNNFWYCQDSFQVRCQLWVLPEKTHPELDISYDLYNPLGTLQFQAVTLWNIFRTWTFPEDHEENSSLTWKRKSWQVLGTDLFSLNRWTYLCGRLLLAIHGNINPVAANGDKPCSNPLWIQRLIHERP